MYCSFALNTKYLLSLLQVSDFEYNIYETGDPLTQPIQVQSECVAGECVCAAGRVGA